MFSRFSRIVFSRRVIVIVLLLIQFAFMGFIIWDTSNKYGFVSIILNLISLFVVIYVINRRVKPAYKITWIILILTSPVFGGLFYLILKLQNYARNFRGRSKYEDSLLRNDLVQKKGLVEKLGEDSADLSICARYLSSVAGFPLYENSTSEYLGSGELFFENLLSEMKKAEKFIFLEFFIVNYSHKVWQDILAVLKERAAAGVECRFMYDDVGSFGVMPLKYDEELKKAGIKCCIFSPFNGVWSTVQNNRDHRKIVVIDGRIAITGGANLADEYANITHPLGHWKDSSVIIRGEAVYAFTEIFLHAWRSQTRVEEDFSRFTAESFPQVNSAGFVQPYADSPFDDENVSEHIYLHMINRAKKYVYIDTPYLIVDNNMISALRLAAKSGIDVRIITPHIPDKLPVHITTRSYYRELITAGVKIYEYTPGFIHSKVVVCDGEIASVGTANFDYRSLYLHFECGVCVYRSETVGIIHDDFIETMNKSSEITPKDCRVNVFMRFIQSILRILAPLM